METTCSCLTNPNRHQSKSLMAVNQGIHNGALEML